MIPDTSTGVVATMNWLADVTSKACESLTPLGQVSIGLIIFSICVAVFIGPCYIKSLKHQQEKEQ